MAKDPNILHTKVEHTGAVLFTKKIIRNILCLFLHLTEIFVRNKIRRKNMCELT